MGSWLKLQKQKRYKGVCIIYGKGGLANGRGGKQSLLPYLGGGGGQKGFTLDLGRGEDI